MMTGFVFLVGQRGVGKSSLLKRVKAALGQLPPGLGFFDLDQEIQIRSGLPIEMIFEQEGESGFRSREKQTFEAWISERSQGGMLSVMVLGAGFEHDAHEVFGRPTTQVIWIKRSSDEKGRIFLDRPRLNPELPPLEEYRSRAAFRGRRFERLATLVHELEEGIGSVQEESDLAETQYFRRVLGLLEWQPKKFTPENLGFVVETLQLESPSVERLRAKLATGLDALELRSDLMPDHWKERFLEWKDLPILFSWRGREEVSPSSLPAHWIQDWAIELGEKPACVSAQIVSLHELLPDENLGQALLRLEEFAHRAGAGVLKASPVVASWDELWEGHQWWMKDPLARVFLPRSSSEAAGASSSGSLWKFYRLWTAGRMRLEFVRGARASAPDQPTLLERNRVQHPCAKWGALIGDPISHSQSPVLHRSYFQSRSREYFAVRLPESLGESGFDQALRVMARMGAEAFSVTSPWKEAASRWIGSQSGEVQLRAQRLKSLNTLFCRTHSDGSTHWSGDNTDLPGFRAIAREVGRRLGLREHRGLEEVAVWGGGGTLSMVKEEFPAAQFFSARTGEFRGACPALYERASEFRPRVIIWAVARGRMQEGAKWPPQEWHPDWVVDLNYSEDSPGREVAQRMGARYLSGLQMFRTQGIEQQLFWHERWKS